jgi:integrase/recombinase XerD
VLEVLRLALDRDLIQKLPRTTKQKGAQKDAPKVLSDEEIKALFKEPSGFFLRPLLMVCLHCGLRLDEGLHLQWSDVDLARSLLHVRVKKDWSPKNHQSRSIPMNARLVAYLKDRKERVEPKAAGLVCPRFKNVPWTPQQVTHHTRKLWQRAGIYERGKPTVHALRHTFATRYLQAGGNLADLQRLLGHSNVSVTSRYLWSNEAGQRAGVEALGFGLDEE